MDEQDDKVVTLRPGAVAPPASEVTDFADMPASIGEHRADEDRDGRSWTPRDALIDVLRRLDKGEIEPRNLAIVWNGRNLELDGETLDAHGQPIMRVSYNVAGPDGVTTWAGLAARLGFLLMDPDC